MFKFLEKVKKSVRLRYVNTTYGNAQSLKSVLIKNPLFGIHTAFKAIKFNRFAKHRV